MSENWICTAVCMTHWAIFGCPKSIGIGKNKLQIKVFLFHIVASRVSFNASFLLSSFDTLVSAEVGSRSYQTPVDIHGFKYHPYTAVSDTLIYHAGFRLKKFVLHLFFGLSHLPLDMVKNFKTLEYIL